MFELETAAAAASLAQAAAAPAGRPAVDPEQQEVVNGGVDMFMLEVGLVKDDCGEFLGCKPKDDGALYEYSERHKVLCSRLEAMAHECKAAANLALEHGLMARSILVDDAVWELHEMRKRADERLLLRRKEGNMWSEKGR